MSKVAVSAASRSSVVWKKTLCVVRFLVFFQTPSIGLELRGVRREAEELQATAVGREPGCAVAIEVVTGTMVDDEKDFPSRPADEQPEKLPEGLRIEDRRTLIVEPGPLLQGECAEDVRGLAHPTRVDAGLDADARPGLVQRPVEPEAGLVLVHDYAAVRGGCGTARRIAGQ